MPTDYKALEKRVLDHNARRNADLDAKQAKAQAEALAEFQGRAKPLVDLLLPELEALRSQMAGEYTVEVSEDFTAEGPRGHTLPSITFEIINDVNEVRSGRITVSIVRRSATAGHGPVDGVQVSLTAKGSREGRDREVEDLTTTLGIQPSALLDQRLAQQIVEHAFTRAAVGSRL
jgi:hypothetical protein